MTSEEKYIFKLFIAGMNNGTNEMLQIIKTQIKNHDIDKFDFEVIDIFSNPEFSESEKIIATPTLIGIHSNQKRKVILDFSSIERLILGVDLVLQDED
jgi:circadian clock protein KaiB